MDKIKKFINRHGSQLCAVALIVSAFVSDKCHYMFYQPKEPEGLSDFSKKVKK